MANAPVLKTGVRKDLGVRIPRPPLHKPGSWARGLDGFPSRPSDGASPPFGRFSQL